MHMTVHGKTIVHFAEVICFLTCKVIVKLFAFWDILFCFLIPYETFGSGVSEGKMWYLKSTKLQCMQ